MTGPNRLRNPEEPPQAVLGAIYEGINAMAVGSEGYSRAISPATLLGMYEDGLPVVAEDGIDYEMPEFAGNLVRGLMPEPSEVLGLQDTDTVVLSVSPACYIHDGGHLNYKPGIVGFRIESKVEGFSVVKMFDITYEESEKYTTSTYRDESADELLDSLEDPGTERMLAQLAAQASLDTFRDASLDIDDKELGVIAETSTLGMISPEEADAILKIVQALYPPSGSATIR